MVLAIAILLMGGALAGNEARRELLPKRAKQRCICCSLHGKSHLTVVH